MIETKGLKCNPVGGLGSNIPALLQRENLFATVTDMEYSIIADAVSGELYEFDKVSKLVAQKDIDIYNRWGYKYRKGWGYFTPNMTRDVRGVDGRITTRNSAPNPLPVVKDFKNSIFTHNHPGGATFSNDKDGDIMLFMGEYGVIEMRAVTYHYINIIQRPSDYERFFSYTDSTKRVSISTIQALNLQKLHSRLTYWYNQLFVPSIYKPYTFYDSYEKDSILQQYLNPDLVNDKKYMGNNSRDPRIHTGMFIELYHLSVANALAEFNIPYSRVRRTTNQEFKNDIKDDKPEEDIVDDTKKRQISEKRVNQRIITQPQTNRIKSTRKDIRGDLFPINPRDRGDLRIKRRNPYPWEDKEYFEKLRKEAEAKKDELDNNPNKQIVTETENPLQKRKAKTKGTKDMVEIVKPSKFEWVPRGKRAIGYGGDKFGGRGINSGNWHPDGWSFRLVPGAEEIKSKDTALGMVSSRNTEGYANGKLPKSFLVSIEGECQAITCLMHYQAAPNYIAMRDAAKRDGIIISYSNCYRPYETQIDYWFNSNRPLGERERFISKPTFSGGKKYGNRDEVIATNSNHGFGKAIDVSYYASRGVGTAKQQEDAQKWINMNGDRFGWYWGDAPDENWHFVFVGK